MAEGYRERTRADESTETHLSYMQLHNMHDGGPAQQPTADYAGINFLGIQETNATHASLSSRQSDDSSMGIDSILGTLRVSDLPHPQNRHQTEQQSSYCSPRNPPTIGSSSMGIDSILNDLHVSDSEEQSSSLSPRNPPTIDVGRAYVVKPKRGSPRTCFTVLQKMFEGHKLSPLLRMKAVLENRNASSDKLSYIYWTSRGAREKLEDLAAAKSDALAVHPYRPELVDGYDTLRITLSKAPEEFDLSDDDDKHDLWLCMIYHLLSDGINLEEDLEGRGVIGIGVRGAPFTELRMTRAEHADFKRFIIRDTPDRMFCADEGIKIQLTLIQSEDTSYAPYPANDDYGDDDDGGVGGGGGNNAEEDDKASGGRVTKGSTSKSAGNVSTVSDLGNNRQRSLRSDHIDEMINHILQLKSNKVQQILMKKLLLNEPLSVRHIQRLQPYCSDYIIPPMSLNAPPCAIICYNTFDRAGAEEEADIICHALSSIPGLQLTRLKWSHTAELSHRLDEHLSSVATNASLLITCFMSHGSKGVLRGSENSAISINAIMEILHKRIPRNIPLVMINQSCQTIGEHSDIAIESASGNVALIRPDTAVLMATVQGENALRGVYIRELSEEIMRSDGLTDILEMHRNAAARVKLFTSPHQIAESRSTLTHKLAFQNMNVLRRQQGVVEIQRPTRAFKCGCCCRKLVEIEEQRVPPCGHIQCTQCVERTTNMSVIPCTECRKLYGHTSIKNLPEVPREIDGALVPSANQRNQRRDMCNGEPVETDCNEKRLCSGNPLMPLFGHSPSRSLTEKPSRRLTGKPSHSLIEIPSLSLIDMPSFTEMVQATMKTVDRLRKVLRKHESQLLRIRVALLEGGKQADGTQEAITPFIPSIKEVNIDWVPVIVGGSRIKAPSITHYDTSYSHHFMVYGEKSECKPIQILIPHYSINTQKMPSKVVWIFDQSIGSRRERLKVPAYLLLDDLSDIDSMSAPDRLENNFVSIPRSTCKRPHPEINDGDMSTNNEPEGAPLVANNHDIVDRPTDQ